MALKLIYQLLVTPATILRWHRHRWTTHPVRAGHPAIPTGVRGTDRPPGHRESNLRVSPRPRRTHHARPPDRRLHRLESPQRGRHRPAATTGRSQPDPLPPRAGPRHPRLRPVPPRHDHPAAVLRVLRHRTRHPSRADPGATADPTGARLTQLPRNLLNIKIIKTPVRAPRANAIAEQFVGTVRRDLLDRVLIVNQRHAADLLSEFEGPAAEGTPIVTLGERSQPMPRAAQEWSSRRETLDADDTRRGRRVAHSHRHPDQRPPPRFVA